MKKRITSIHLRPEPPVPPSTLQIAMGGVVFLAVYVNVMGEIECVEINDAKHYVIDRRCTVFHRYKNSLRDHWYELNRTEEQCLWRVYGSAIPYRVFHFSRVEFADDFARKYGLTRSPTIFAP